MADLEVLAALRLPFDPSQVGVLPQPYKKDSPKGNCAECGKYHGLPAMHLDFVGHGAVTQRLLDVDPEWNWEPFAVAADGLPATDKFGNLWIRLTIGGVTRIGVGDGASMKVLIGDALRNAAMRFGVALDLWVRGTEDEKKDGNESLPPVAAPVPGFRSSLVAATENLSEDERTHLRLWLVEQGLPDRPSKMNAAQADRVCDYIMHGLPGQDAATAASVASGAPETPQVGSTEPEASTEPQDANPETAPEPAQDGPFDREWAARWLDSLDDLTVADMLTEYDLAGTGTKVAKRKRILDHLEAEVGGLLVEAADGTAELFETPADA